MNLASSFKRLFAGSLIAALTTMGALAVGCGGGAATQGSAPKPGEFDPCTGSKPVPHEYHGVLRNARCDQDMFLTMASVAEQLGVECKHCHAQKPGGKDEDYPPMTPNKETANWMSVHLMQAVKLKDGSPVKCKSCHVDDKGKPLLKILGEPRDRAKAADWMSSVLVENFVAADGARLKCKSCHVGAPGTPSFEKKVIGKSDQIPKHEPGKKGSPSF